MEKKKGPFFSILAALVGNALELYDFMLYGFFAAVFAELFFPLESPLSGLIASYGIFATGFLIRPLGAVFIGYLGDCFGRKRALEISILAMLVPTLLMGLLPTYASIGIAAPILLMALRTLQGFSVGGELVGSYAFLFEASSADRRGFVSSWTVVGGFLGKALAIGVLMVLTKTFANEQILAWAWRLPFLLGTFFAIGGLLVRRSLAEPSDHSEKVVRKKMPVIEALTTCRKPMLQAFGLTIALTIGVYIINIYMPVYLHTQRGIGYDRAALSTLISLTCSMITLPTGGALSDRLGRRPVMLCGALLLAIGAYPCFNILMYGSHLAMMMAHSALGVAMSLLYGVSCAVYMELFPRELRQTACGIAYNACVMLFGGLTPMIVTILIQQTGNPLAPAYWLAAGGVITSFTIATIPETHSPLTVEEAATA